MVRPTVATPLPPTLREENRRLTLLQSAQAGMIRSLMDEVTRLSGELRERNEDYARYGNRIFALDMLAEAETERGQLQTRLDDIEDPPIKEPQRPVDMGSGDGPEVMARRWREGVGS